jgi:hypothetical protein
LAKGERFAECDDCGDEIPGQPTFNLRDSVFNIAEKLLDKQSSRARRGLKNEEIGPGGSARNCTARERLGYGVEKEIE